jgi:hypothetical protein
MPKDETGNDAPIRITDIGARAGALLATTGDWRVETVFDRAFYLAADLPGQLICIGLPELGRGPLMATCEALAFAAWSDQGVGRGQSARCDGAYLHIGDGLRLDLANARTWTTPAWPPRPASADLARTLAEVRRQAAPRLPEGSLAGFLVAPDDAPPAGAIARAAGRTASLRIAALADWLDAALDGSRDLDAVGREAAHGLLGLGAGLTPAGDDLLSGLLIALHALGRDDLARRLAGFIDAASATATSPMSRAFLACAAAGEPSEALHAMLAGAVIGDPQAISRGLDALAGTGHSSGFDMLAGALLALDAETNVAGGRMT